MYTHYPFTQIREADPPNPQNSRHTTTLKVKTYDTLLYQLFIKMMKILFDNLQQFCMVFKQLIMCFSELERCLKLIAWGVHIWLFFVAYYGMLIDIFKVMIVDIQLYE